MSPNLNKDATVYSKQQLFASWGLKYLLTSFFIISEFCRSRVIIIERVIKLQHSLLYQMLVLGIFWAVQLSHNNGREAWLLYLQKDAYSQKTVFTPVPCGMLLYF